MRRLLASPALRWFGTAVLGAATGALAWLAVRELPNGDGDVEPDLDHLRRRLAAVAGPDAIRLRTLGPGIVELVGRVDRADVVPALLAEASETEGVEVVVNRLWSPGKRRAVAQNPPIDAPSGARYSSLPADGASGGSDDENDVADTT